MWSRGLVPLDTKPKLDSLLGFGLSPEHLVHWTWLNGDMCSKMDTCQHINGSSATRHWT